MDVIGNVIMYALCFRNFRFTIAGQRRKGKLTLVRQV